MRLTCALGAACVGLMAANGAAGAVDRKANAIAAAAVFFVTLGIVSLITVRLSGAIRD